MRIRISLDRIKSRIEQADLVAFIQRAQKEYGRCDRADLHPVRIKKPFDLFDFLIAACLDTFSMHIMQFHTMNSFVPDLLQSTFKIIIHLIGYDTFFHTTPLSSLWYIFIS